jgi:hypothetical protein
MGPETIIGQLRQTMTDRYISDKMQGKASFAAAWEGLFGSLEYTAVIEQQRGTEITIDWSDGAETVHSAAEVWRIIFDSRQPWILSANGTIFKYALLTSIGLFFMYAIREIPAKSKLSLYFSPLSMALITSVSFLLGSVCSAIAGYAGIWVSVRANVRVAAAARKCYNDAMQICFRGGAFAAIINVALAIFGISSLYLGFEFYFYSMGA